MKVRTSVKKLGATIRGRKSFNSLLEAFVYKLGQVSGVCFGRLAVATDERIPAQHTADLANFMLDFQLNVDIGDTTARWLKAHFTATPNIGHVHCAVTGDKDSLVRLEEWLIRSVYSLYNEVCLNAERTELTFMLSDTHHMDVRDTIRAAKDRVAAAADHIQPDL
ncbi:MAG TPA: hypothetical protein VJM32_06335 [Candidatus Saccharimonadales bacterium]|nr:hypothetical protein [Candidatus Saccharimonadales bacterium]